MRRKLSESHGGVIPSQNAEWTLKSDFTGAAGCDCGCSKTNKECLLSAACPTSVHETKTVANELVEQRMTS